MYIKYSGCIQHQTIPLTHMSVIRWVMSCIQQNSYISLSFVYDLWFHEGYMSLKHQQQCTLPHIYWCNAFSRLPINLSRVSYQLPYVIFYPSCNQLLCGNQSCCQFLQENTQFVLLTPKHPRYDYILIGYGLDIILLSQQTSILISHQLCFVCFTLGIVACPFSIFSRCRVYSPFNNVVKPSLACYISIRLCCCLTTSPPFP